MNLASKPDERVSDAILKDLAADGIGSVRVSIVTLMAKELLSRRRGEWICKSCGLRQDPAQQDSDGGIPW
jgi:hypothetical protein